jgi:hypothetical protein
MADLHFTSGLFQNIGQVLGGGLHVVPCPEVVFAAVPLPVLCAGMIPLAQKVPSWVLSPHTLPLLSRCGLALALNKLSQYLDSSQVKPLFQFFVPDALNDRNPDVRKCMLDAALATLNAHGKVRSSL